MRVPRICTVFSPRSVLFLVTLCLLAATAAANTQSPAREAQPSRASSSSTVDVPVLEVPERSHHLGKISLDQQYEHSFRVFNVGTGLLEIEKVTVG